MFATVAVPLVLARGSAASTSWGWWDWWEGGCTCGSCNGGGQRVDASFEFSDAAWTWRCLSCDTAAAAAAAKAVVAVSEQQQHSRSGKRNNSTSISGGGSSSSQPLVCCVDAISCTVFLYVLVYVVFRFAAT